MQFFSLFIHRRPQFVQQTFEYHPPRRIFRFNALLHLVGPVVAFLFQTSLFFQIDDEFVFVQFFQRVHLVVVAQQQLQFTPQGMKPGQARVFRLFVLFGDNVLVLAFDARE